MGWKKFCELLEPFYDYKGRVAGGEFIELFNRRIDHSLVRIYYMDNNHCRIIGVPSSIRGTVVISDYITYKNAIKLLELMGLYMFEI